jgi:cysteinyl-tRNA synthetase
VGIYDCGPTVWGYQHIGNLYRYVVADVIRRTFEYAGYDVRQVMNITDVGAIMGDVDEGEDRMDVAARREGKDPLEIAQRYTDIFMADRRRLNVLDPHVMPKATDHIDKGHAYVAPDGVYFDISTFPGYGTRLNRELPEARLAGARIEVNPHKRHPADFALWRGAKPEDRQQWGSPWGKGKPGWHIECSAMSMKYLDETFDLHSGGEDHLFPHHECEIAQSEAATGRPFVRHWVHVYFLRIESGDMHKSTGNVHLLSDLDEWGFEPAAFRLFVLGTSYRKGLDFSRDALAQAQQRLARWRSSVVAAAQPTAGAASAVDPADPIRREFLAAVCDDVNTPRALAAAESALGLANAPTDGERSRALGLLLDMDRVLGLGVRAWVEGALRLDDDERALLEERAAARAAGDYARSDELRERLLERGIRVKDTKDGQRWERVPPQANGGRA